MTKPYDLPDPRKRPDSWLTCLYKTMKAIEFDDRVWDKEFFGRCNKRTQFLLEIFEGDVKGAAVCMQALKEKFEGDGIDWTIETICKYAFEWRSQQKHLDDRECLRRFLGEVVKKERIGDLQRVDLANVLGRIQKALPAAPEGGKENGSHGRDTAGIVSGSEQNGGDGGE